MACYLHEVLRLSARVEDGGDDDEGEGDEVEEEGRDHTGCCLQSHLVVESESGNGMEKVKLKVKIKKKKKK